MGGAAYDVSGDLGGGGWGSPMGGITAGQWAFLSARGGVVFVLVRGLWSPGAGGFEGPVWCCAFGDVVGFVAVAGPVAGLFVVEGVCAAGVDGDDVVDVEAAWVEVGQ